MPLHFTSIQDTADSSNIEESVLVSVQVSQDAQATFDPSGNDAKHLDETDQNDLKPLLAQGNEESLTKQSPQHF